MYPLSLVIACTRRGVFAELLDPVVSALSVLGLMLVV